MELLIAPIARRYATGRNDQMPLASARAEIRDQRRGEIDDIGVARVGRDLVATIHPYQVMVSPARPSYHRSEVAETVRHSDPAPKIARPHATSDGTRSIKARADV